MNGRVDQVVHGEASDERAVVAEALARAISDEIDQHAVYHQGRGCNFEIEDKKNEF